MCEWVFCKGVSDNVSGRFGGPRRFLEAGCSAGSVRAGKPQKYINKSAGNCVWVLFAFDISGYGRTNWGRIVLHWLKRG
jgi:hypothetical protein